jgi:leader peptidase (prepilin peptidase)/N-methyltransferase
MTFFYIVTFIFGLVIGSFLNVCIYRLPRDKSVVFPPSSCPGCNARIKPYHNIPVISYLLLGGKCASCGTRISPIYPAVELLNGLMYMAVLYRFGLTGQAVLIMAIVSTFIVITFIDIEHRIIPNEITYPGIPLSLLLGPLVLHTGFLNSFIGAVAGGGFLFGVSFLVSAIIKMETLGFGDVKLIAMVGGLLGWKLTLLTIFLGSALGSVAGIGLIYIKKMDRRAMIPFGPFLVFGALVSLFFGQEIIDWYFGFASLPLQ